MEFAHRVNFSTLRNCKCDMDCLRLNHRLFFQFRKHFSFWCKCVLFLHHFSPLRDKLIVDLFLLCLLLQVGFHLRQICLQRSGFALCNRVNIYLNTCDVNAVLMKHIEKIIFSGGTGVFHNHIQIRIFLLDTPATASGYYHIHNLCIQTVLVYLRLYIGIYRLFYILCTLSVQTMKQFFCLCSEICNHIRIVLSEFCLLCFQICPFHFLRFFWKLLIIYKLHLRTRIYFALQIFVTIILLCDWWKAWFFQICNYHIHCSLNRNIRIVINTAI